MSTPDWVSPQQVANIVSALWAAGCTHGETPSVALAVALAVRFGLTGDHINAALAYYVEHHAEIAAILGEGGAS